MEGSLHYTGGEAMTRSGPMIVNWSRILIRTLLIATVLAGSICLESEGSYSFSKHQKAYYANRNVINFVRPGTVFKISSASIAQDGTITARVLVTDAAGL